MASETTADSAEHRRTAQPTDDWAVRWLAATDTAVLHVLDGEITHANDAALGRFGGRLVGHRLDDVVPTTMATHTPGPAGDRPAQLYGVAAVDLQGNPMTLDVELTPLAGRRGEVVVEARPTTGGADGTGSANDRGDDSPWAVLVSEVLVLASGLHHRHVALVLLDLDNFRQVNEIHGRATGDQLLEEVQARLAGDLGEGQRLVRLPGDACAVVCAATDIQDLQRQADRLAQVVSRPLMRTGDAIHVSAGAGAAMATGPVTSLEDVERLTSGAEMALRSAKALGRGRVVVLDKAAREEASRRIDMEAALAGALGRGEFFLAFQAIRDLAEDRTAGAEALLRWRHPRLGLVPPGRFLDVAEETGLIDAIGLWVVSDALRTAATWDADRWISVNVSARQLRAPGFATLVKAALNRAGVAPERLHLELTESVLVDSPEVALHEIALLRDHGVRVGIDDFGTGFASMAYLKQLPVDFLKIDREFVWGLPDSPIDVAIVESSVTLAQARGLTVIAEGVEEPAQANALRALGCRYAQGYAYARPVPASELDPAEFS